MYIYIYIYIHILYKYIQVYINVIDSYIYIYIYICKGRSPYTSYPPWGLASRPGDHGGRGPRVRGPRGDINNNNILL